MKHLIPIFIAASLALPVHAQQPSAATLLGSWSVDTSLLPMAQEARPKRVTITFSQTQPDRMTTRVEVVGAANEHFHAHGTSTMDGRPAPVEGNLEANAAAGMMLAPGLLVMQLARDGMPVSTRVYSAAPDGLTMVESVAYVGADGQPLVKTNHFSRIK